MNGDYDNGQFEMTLCFDDALKACDDAMLFRMMARELAYRSGYLLTLTPKPMPERVASGLHVILASRIRTAPTSSRWMASYPISPTILSAGC